MVALIREVGLREQKSSGLQCANDFARCLLTPEAWVRALPESERHPDRLSERFQVPPFDAVTRLAELGLPISDEAVPGLDT